MSEECRILREDLLLILKRLEAYRNLCRYYDEQSGEVYPGDVSNKLEEIEFMEMQEKPLKSTETDEDFWKNLDEMNEIVDRHITMMNRLYKAAGKDYMSTVGNLRGN